MTVAKVMKESEEVVMGDKIELGNCRVLTKEGSCRRIL